VKVLAVIGTRPDAIKMAPLIKRLKKTKNLELVVLSSGQHTDLLNSVLREFEIKADICFELKREKSGLHFLVSELTRNFDHHLPLIQPDVVLGHGDTATCFAAALSSFHQGFKFFHIEAGLRSYDLTSPYPEEFYRQSISKMTHTHFCPDAEAKDNLLREGVNTSRIVVSGNTIEESLSFALKQEHSAFEHGKFILMSIHRREKTDHDFIKLQEILYRHPKKKFIFIEHPNPELKRKLDLYLRPLPNLKVIPPQSYFACASLVKCAQIILTDSGGMQEEASLLHKPQIIFRSKSEREINQSHALLSMDVELIDQALDRFFLLDRIDEGRPKICEKKVSPSSFVELTLIGAF
jgi:UDP-N-acetylglucosamine 2-epimerase (non-hydrolysing)